MSIFTQLPQLRITVNSRCGRRCFYCRPSGEAISTIAGVELDPEMVFKVCRVFSSLGGTEVKLTGGDPALWDPLVDCVRQLKRETDLSVHVISRHPKIGLLASGLADAGVDLINLSIDTLNPVLHKSITGVDDLPKLLVALEKCVLSGVPCKVNIVVMSGVNDEEIDSIINYCENSGIRSVKLLDMIQDLEDGSENYVGRLPKVHGDSLRNLYTPLEEISERLCKRAVGSKTLTQGDLGHPMLELQLPSGMTAIVKNHRLGAWYGEICTGCRFYPCHDALMALRLTADARLQFCLLREDVAIDIKSLVSDDSALEEVFSRALGVYNSATFTTKVN